MKALLIMSALLFSSWAQAQGIVINPSLTYASRDIEDTGANIGKMDTLIIDLKSGYLFSFGLFAGLQAVHYSGSTGGSDLSAYQVGPSIGYTHPDVGLFFSATYHLFGSFELEGVTTSEWDKVSGVQVDIGYPVAITDMISFGPQLSYKNIKHEDDDNVLADFKTRELTPYFGLWIQF